MAELSLIYWGITALRLPFSLLPMSLSHSCSSSRLRGSAKSSIEAFGFWIKDVLLLQIENFQEKILVLPKEMKKSNFWRVVLSLCQATFKNRRSNTRSCFIVPLGRYSNIRDSLRICKHWKKNENKNWTNLDFNTFCYTYWQAEKKWQIRSIKIPFPPNRTLCFKMHVH